MHIMFIVLCHLTILSTQVLYDFGCLHANVLCVNVCGGAFVHVHRKNSIEIRDEMCCIIDCSFLRFTMFGITKQKLDFIVARRFLNSA